jgi:hypothetical protein
MSKDILKKVAGLESKVDALESELSHLDVILRRSGFPQGINTLRSTVEELLGEVEGHDQSNDDLDGLFA